MTTKPHYFNRYLKKGYSDKEYIVTVAKNTKKAVKEAIEVLDNIEKKDSNAFVLVDATILKDSDKMKDIFIYALKTFRNINEFRLFTVLVDFGDSKNENKEYVDLFNKIFKEGFFDNKNNHDIKILNKILSKKINHLVDSLNKIKSNIEKVLDNTKEIKDNIKHEKQLSFMSSNRGLMDIYESCFNPYLVLVEPGLAVNPNPSFQRDLVWDIDKKQNLIRSILNEIPIGAIYINVFPYNAEWELGEGYGSVLWDGKQRLHAIHSFLKDEFPVIINNEEVYYSEAPYFFARALQNASILVYETKFDNLNDIIKAYVLINKSQVKHSDNDLKKAEDYLLSKVSD